MTKTKGAQSAKTKKKRGRSSLILRLCVFAFVVYAAVHLIDIQINIAGWRRQLVELEQRVEVQRIANRELERQLVQAEDEHYIERIARERLGFVLPDESVYVDISGR